MSLLKNGDRGLEVAMLIARLKELGFPSFCNPMNCDPLPWFDNEVRKAVMRFQSQFVGPDRQPLVIDGVVGPLTAYALKNADKWQAEPPILTFPPPTLAGMPAGTSPSGWAALQRAIGEMNAGACEQDGPNNGPFCKKYLATTGLPVGNPWCAAFICWCFKQDDGSTPPFTYSARVTNVFKRFKKNGWVVKPTFAEPPLPGDLVFWWRNSIASGDGHIGIVSGYSDGILHTIEGNRTSRVEAFHYKLGDIQQLLGFGRVSPTV